MSIRKIGLIGAMQEEIEAVSGKMEHMRISEKAGITFREGTLFGVSAVLCKCGVGKVNAAVCTQILIDVFDVDAVIFTGVAGALDPSLDIGDIVISEDCLHHDMDVTALGFDPGVIPYEQTSVFAADPDLVDRALAAGRAVGKGKTIRGRVLSGDQFIADRGKVRMLHEKFRGSCTEMEGAAVGQVCVMNQIPYVIIRSMSDKADGSAHLNFAEFTRMAAANSSRIVEEMLGGMRRDDA